MVKMKKALPVLFIALFLLAHSCTNKDEVRKNFTLSSIATSNSDAAKLIRNSDKQETLVFTPCHSTDSIVISPYTNHELWAARYLIAEIKHDNPYSTILYFDFYTSQSSEAITTQGSETASATKHRPSLLFKVGVLPHLQTKVVIPLSYLNGQSIFLPRYGRQLKGFAAGSRTRAEDVTRICLRIGPYMKPGYTPSVEITSIFLSDTFSLQNTGQIEPIVDCYGQWTARTWPGKIANDKELAAVFNVTQKISPASDTSELSHYGGWLKKRFKATGFFRTQHDGKRWWLVDPDGYGFISNGCNCIRPGTAADINGREELFSQLPGKNDSLFAECYETKHGLTYDFVKSNFIRIYGKQWLQQWYAYTLKMFRSMGFNTIANWSDTGFIRYARRPYVYTLQRYPTTTVNLFRDFPDVFSAEYKKSAVDYARQLSTIKDDRYLIGYFLQNEPHWAFGDFILAHEMLKTNTPSATRDRLTEWLKNKYTSINRLNTEWKTRYSSFDAITATPLLSIPSEAAKRDLIEFTGLMVDTYIDVVTTEVKKIDQNHLNLGMRYAWMSSDLCYRAGKNFDVFSVNGYSFPGPPSTDEITRRTGKPVMIGEFHFGSADRGLPANGIQGAKNETDRGKAYRYYIDNGYSRPELIGIHYFQWYDQPVTGRFDGENYGIGLLDICSQPYHNMINQMMKSHNNLYRIANGLIKPYDTIVEKVPQIYY